MKRKRYSEEQIAFALWQAESGAPVEEICRKLGVSEPTIYRWKRSSLCQPDAAARAGSGQPAEEQRNSTPRDGTRPRAASPG